MDAEPKEDCVICFKKILYYAFGECNHPVCYECLTRMRVLCDNKECPICRKELVKVYFTTKRCTYADAFAAEASFLPDRRFGIFFENGNLQTLFEILLSHRCSFCNAHPFREFEQLKRHIATRHGYFYCDICTDNIKIFSSERKLYIRKDLSAHKREGDHDDTAQRGHPLCKYCNDRYFDKDALYRHLRKEHLFCHICDNEGLNQFYGDLLELRDHFKTNHFLCEEGECAGEMLVSVFRTEIDFKAHQINRHGRTRKKDGRMLDLEFALVPRQRQHDGRGGDRGGGRGERDSEPAVAAPAEPVDFEVAFPSLGGPSNGAGPSSVAPVRPAASNAASFRRSMPGSKFKVNEENFPTLPSSNSTTLPPPANGGPSAAKWLAKNPRPEQPRRVQPAAAPAPRDAAVARNSVEEFPTLGRPESGGLRISGFGRNAAAAASQKKPPVNKPIIDWSSSNKKSKNGARMNGKAFAPLPLREYSFQPPMDAPARNQKLMKLLKKLARNPEALAEFRTVSKDYQTGDCNSERYFEQCKKFLGIAFSDTFPELLVLLPDIKRQRELFALYAKHRPGGQNGKIGLAECFVCEQVVHQNELSWHQRTHDTDFPVL